MTDGFNLHDVQKVYEVLNSWRTYTYDIPAWLGYSALSDETELSKCSVSKIIKWMKLKNIVMYDFAITDEGKLHGSGYFLTYPYVDKPWDKVKGKIEKMFNGIANWYNTTSVLERRGKK